MNLTFHPYAPEWVSHIRNGGPMIMASPPSAAFLAALESLAAIA